ncbi:histidinol-phosphate aminotransferase [Lysobacter concretionis Ko07 = DSM 16239]|uniref:Histidinol-phosphate aminotransferase n=2 Tax=Novilysobacter TaxID=3382699 RepID=A0A0A0EPA9_9GAMM|nr:MULTISPECIES: histidinol-phosphate transaminase [Lysobacter]KGM51953.1 histidinol-phosphate aminotransferase [Lysobacter concretionis Ko07 = DSM 16239]QOD90308.1 histidinol-phosphate transaminase [Lysobacter sp. CW239]
MSTLTMPSDPLALVRSDLAGFSGYSSARTAKLDGDIWLNANELSWPNVVDVEGTLRRYPDPQPERLRAALARRYGCSPSQLLVGRGSDEAIDLLVRALCRPGGDTVLVTPPTFGMYAVCARLHGTRVVEVALSDGADGFSCDFEAIAQVAQTQGVKLVFLCSPGNPTGNLLPLDAVETLARTLAGRALVVVDEAYGEFSQSPSAVSLLARHRNVAVLRTLSKAHALAGARIGSVIADAALITVLQRCQAPYPLPTPCIDVACRALESSACAATDADVASVIVERERLGAALQAATEIRQVYPSRSNFLLVRFHDAQAALERLLSAGIVVRDQRATPGLENALRITVGSHAQNNRVIDVIDSLEMGA